MTTKFASWLNAALAERDWTQAKREILNILPDWIRGQDARKVNSFLLRLVREIVVTPEGEITVRLRD